MSTFTIFLVLITIVCFLLIIVIMVQNPKGGGLSSSIGGGTQQLGGVQKTTDFLDKSTWVLGGALILLVLLSSLSFSGAAGDNDKIIDASQSKPATEAEATEKKADDKAATPTQTPATPEKK